MNIPVPRRSPEAAGPPSLTNLLSSDHEEIDRLISLALMSIDSGLAADACVALDRIWIRLAVHIRAEHKVVFPALAETHSDLRAPLQTLHEDHDYFMASLAGSVKSMHGPSPDFASARTAVEVLKLRLAAHNALEEGGVYPLVDKLPREQLTPILDQVARELAFLPPRYGP